MDEKIKAAFDAWVQLDETARLMFDCAITGYIRGQSLNPAPPAERKRGRPKGSRGRKTNGAPALAAEVQ